MASRLVLCAFLLSTLADVQGFTNNNNAVFNTAAGASATKFRRTVLSRSTQQPSPVTQLFASISSGDSVLVVGGTGGVGQLTAKKLLAESGISVGVTSRKIPSSSDDDNDSPFKRVRLDLVNSSDSELQAAVNGYTALVIAVGTTAFPTKQWAGGNTPQAIDDVGVSRLARAAAQSESVKKIVLVTSIGVERTDMMPFKVLNLFGVLDAKRKGEEAVQNSGIEYVIVRPGRLIGAPFTNLDLATLFQVGADEEQEHGATIELGDSLLGECQRYACAEAIVQALKNDNCKNVAFAIVSNEDEPALSDEQWTKAFASLSG